MPKATRLTLEYRPTTVNATLHLLIQQARELPTHERNAAQHALLRDTALMAAVLRARALVEQRLSATATREAYTALQAARAAYADNKALYTPLLNAHLSDAYMHNQAVAKLLATPDGTI